MTLKDRAKGALLGLACGDALGTTAEFKERDSFPPITDMIGGGPHGLNPGEWTDDTSMALCLAESLIECKGFDPKDQMKRYLRWWEEGHWSSRKTHVDIGETVRAALLHFKETGEPLAGPTDPHTAGNGSLMRLAPIPIYFSNNAEEATRFAAESSKTTHGAKAAVDACRYFAGLVFGALHGVDKEELLSEQYSPAETTWKSFPLCEEIKTIAHGSFKTKTRDQIQATGYVVHTLEAALWAFANSSSFEEGALKAANLGQDADTTSAVYGQLAGAHYGVDGIPKCWREMVVRKGEIKRIADQLT